MKSVTVCEPVYCPDCGETIAYEDAECWYCETKKEVDYLKANINEIEKENTKLRRLMPDEEMRKAMRTALMLANDQIYEGMGLFDSPSPSKVQQEKQLMQLGEWLYELGRGDDN